MDTEGKGARVVLTALAEMNEHLVSFARELRLRDGVSLVRQGMEPRVYESGPIFEAFVDAELTNGKAIAWCVDVRWGDSGFLIEASIRVNDSQGQHALHGFEEQHVTEVEVFAKTLSATLMEVLCAPVDLKAL